MPFRPEETTILENASEDAIFNIFDTLHLNFPANSFLSANNYLDKKPVKTIEKQSSKRPKKRKKYLSKYSGEYIASSSVLHNIDGWTYFGHAINSILRGDNLTSRHLLYYSELRGVMSILATAGIGVFNDRHIVLNKHSKIEFVNLPYPKTPPKTGKNYNTIGTHNFTWEAIDHIFSIPKNQLNFLKKISVDSISFYQWLDAFGITDSHKQSIAKNLFKKLTIDLASFVNDRDARNDVSYRPSGFLNTVSVPGLDILKQIQNIWLYVEPIGKGDEFKLDVYLLREILQIAFKHVHSSGYNFKRASVQYRRRLTNMLNHFGLPQNRKDELVEVFCVDDTEFYDVLGIKDLQDIKYTQAILFRSLLILRFSSLYCNQVFKNSPSVDKVNLEFWWKNVGNQLGLWPTANEPDEFADLWQDFDSANEKIEELLQNGNPLNVNDLSQHHSAMGIVLCASSKIALWGTGL